MNELIHVSNALSTRVSRTTNRAVERVRTDQQVATAIETAKVEVIADATESALVAASHIAVIESMLADRVPHAEGRLHQIAKAGTTGLTEIVAKAAQEVR